MRKTYAAPAVVMNGNVVRETLGGIPVVSETPDFKNPNTSSLGFYL
jgi:hypothetical protein